MVDVTGKMVHSEKMNAGKQTVNTQGLNTGLYFVNLKTDTGKLVYATKMSVVR